MLDVLVGDDGLKMFRPNHGLVPFQILRKWLAFVADLPDLFGVSRVVMAQDQSSIEVVDLRGEPRCERSWKRDGTVRQRSDGGTLSDRDAEALGIA